MYRVAEGSLAVPAVWQDQSINVLIARDSRVQGANLVIARDRVPMGLTFPDYVAQQRQTFLAQLDECEILADSPGAVGGREAQLMELSWRSEGRPIHQVMAIVLGDADQVLTFTGSIPGGRDEDTREALIGAITSFTFGH